MGNHVNELYLALSGAIKKIQVYGHQCAISDVTVYPNRHPQWSGKLWTSYSKLELA